MKFYNEKYIITCVGAVSTLFVFELLVIANNSDSVKEIMTHRAL